jgi:hypothetical protein
VTAAQRRQRGQGLVELVLVVPIFVFILLGLLEFGFMFNHNLTLEYASREGARAGAAMSDGSLKDSNCGAGPLTAANVDPLIVAAVERVMKSPGSMVDVGQVSQIRIFKANGSGAELGPVNVWNYRPGNTFNPLVPCQAPAQFLDFYPAVVGWPASTRVTGATPDSLGVSITYTYRFATPLGGLLRVIGGNAWTSVAVNDRTVMALQPTD